MKNSDLHTHSYYSDGLLSPKELVQLAKKRKIKNLALTDHDSIAGVREAIKEGKKLKINVIPAVEIRCDKSEILGYFIDINNKALLKKLKKSAKKNQDATKNWCERLEKAGYDITFKEIYKKYKKAQGNINEFYPLFELHLKGYGSTLEVAKKLSEEKLSTKKYKRMKILRAIKLVKKASGVPVIAHPWFAPETLLNKNMKKYVKAGLAGIEINNGDNLAFMKYISEKKDIVSRIREIAKKYNLILTSGTDFHGKALIKQMPGNHDLGKNNCDEKVVEQLISFTNRI